MLSRDRLLRLLFHCLNRLPTINQPVHCARPHSCQAVWAAVGPVATIYLSTPLTMCRKLFSVPHGRLIVNSINFLEPCQLLLGIRCYL